MKSVRHPGFSWVEPLRTLTTIGVVVLATTLVLAHQALAAPGIEITKTDSSDPVASGAELTYTITVVNPGGAAVTDLVLTDQVQHFAGLGVPPQLILTSSRGSCAQSFLQSYYLVSCSAASLGGRESWTVTIRGIVTAPDGTTINNTATVTATKSSHTFTASATETTLISSPGGSDLPDLTINKAGPSTAEVSSPLLYTLTVNNIGSESASDITVVDSLPAGVDLVSATGNSLFVCSPAGPMVAPVVVTCTGGRVNAGSNATITIEATTPPTEGTITNTAVVDPNDDISESNELNNTSASVATTVASGPAPSQLEITNNDSPDPVTPGGLLTYTIIVTNTGSGSRGRASDVTVVSGTQGLGAASITATAVADGGLGTCTVVGSQVTCSPPGSRQRLAGGETMTVTIAGQVLASAGTSIINTATVNGNIENQGVSNSATAITEIAPAVDLTITSIDQPDPVCARSWPDASGVSDLEVCEGGLTYTFVVGNSGIVPATGVLVRSPLAEGLVIDSFLAPDFAGGCSVDAANVLTCSDGTIGSQSTSTITVVLVAPPATGSIVNTVTVDPNNSVFEADETNNTFTITTQVNTGIDLTIFKFDEPTNPVNPDPEGPYDPVTAGFDPIATSGRQVYSLVVDNIGTQDATDIRVRDFLPAGTTFLSAAGDNGFQCSYVAAGHYVECTQGQIRGTATEVYFAQGTDDARITIELLAQPSVGTMHNEAKVDPLHEIDEVNEANNLAVEDTEVTVGDATIGAFNELTILKTQTDPPLVNGDLDPAEDVATNGSLVFTINVGNVGTDPVTGVHVRDFLPTGSRFREATADNGFLCSESGGVVDCVGGTLDGTLNLLPSTDASATITIKIFAPAAPGFYPNQAIVDPNDTIAEGNEFNNASSLTTEVAVGGLNAFIDLTITKQDDIADHVAPDGLITYTVTVGNTGSDPAFNVKVRDFLPANTTFVSAVGTGGFTCGESGGIVECINGSVAAAGAETITIKVLAPADIESLAIDKSNISVQITNQAQVDPDNEIPEGDETNNSAAETTTVKSDINLTIDKTGPETANQSTEQDYVLTVKNTGIAPAFDVEVYDPLPVGLIPLSVEAVGTGGQGAGTNFSCEVTENPVNVVHCIGDLDGTDNLFPGLSDMVQITIHVFVTADGGPLDNEACVDPDDHIEEINELDNCKTKTTVVLPPAPDLSMNKSADSGTVTPGQALTYTLNVSNVGQAVAPNPVTVTDTLPTEVTFVSASATNGFTCSEVSGLVACTDFGSGLAVGSSTTITIQVTVNTGVTLPFTNTANVAQAAGETNAGNNSDSVTTSVGGSPVELVLAGNFDSPDPVNPGQVLTYNILAGNTGTTDAAAVLVQSVMDDMTGLEFVGAAGSEGFSCVFDGGDTVDCIGNLAGGGAFTIIEISYLVNAAAPPSHTLTATVDPDDAYPESDELNNSAAAVTTVTTSLCTSCIDLAMGTILDTPDPAAENDLLTYTFAVGNAGDLATNINDPNDLVRIDATLDPDVTFSEVSIAPGGICDGGTSTCVGGIKDGDGCSVNEDCQIFGFTCTDVGTCDGGTNTCTPEGPFFGNSCASDADCFFVRCDDGVLGPGEGVIVTIKATVNPGIAPTTLNTTADVDPANIISEFNESNNSAFTSTDVP